jgi:hypothetical protein
MPMTFTLAIALECSPNECRVQLLDADTPITVRYSPPVQARLIIRPGQLVALDTTPSPPEIVYRWHYARVEQLKGANALIDNHRGQLVEVVPAKGLEVAPKVGDWVFATLGGPAGQSEIFDVAIDGRPAHPVFLSNYAFPKVEEFYRKITGKS